MTEVDITSPREIREAVTTLILGIATQHQGDSSDAWIVQEDGAIAGRRVFQVLADPTSHRWRGKVWDCGENASTWTYDLRVRVTYSGVAERDQEEMAMDDHRTLWGLFHPRGPDGVTSMHADEQPPRIEVYEEGDDHATFDFVFSVEYLGQHGAA